MRLIKQLFFGTAFLVFVFGAGFGIWYLNTERPTCFDGIKNGQEEGVDCGLLACGISCPPPVLDLEIGEPQIIKISDSEYDFVVQIQNPNALYGASRVFSVISLFDNGGKEIYSDSLVFYVLPGQTKYLIAPAIRGVTGAVRAGIDVSQINWEGYNPLGTVRFPLLSQERSFGPNGSNFTGVIRNDSDFDFDTVQIRVVVRNSSNGIIAVGAVPVLTLRAKSDRHFVMSWPYQIPGFENSIISVESDTNLFENSNFLRVYGDNSEPFQKFY